MPPIFPEHPGTVKKRECIAMLLAGGQGSRLGTLTDHTAKPAVSFGGKYRIIDFALSNCINSGIDVVGALTQYEPLSLNEYIGNGGPWDLDRLDGGISVLPPYRGKKTGDWYRGTANAVYQNLNFIEKYSPEYVLILSADHVYRMDYSRMIDSHRRSGAACTVAAVRVPFDEAGRFGIISPDGQGVIRGFEEKPEHPVSDLASMGIYVFSFPVLRKYLTEDEKDPKSQNDFGRNIIPAMLAAGEKLCCYEFSGYWRDVGTVESLWNANMDVVRGVFSLGGPGGRIFSRNFGYPPQSIGEKAVLRGSVITEGCEIMGTVIGSVLSSGVTVEKGAVVRNSVLMSGCRVCENAVVERTVADRGTVILPGARVGRGEETGGITVLGAGERIG